MRFLVAVLLMSSIPVFANGGWSGGYIGKGTLMNSCGGSENFISFIRRSGWDAGESLYYAVKLASGDVRVISDDVLLSYQKVIFGKSTENGRKRVGNYHKYEDCPNREEGCNGGCCGGRPPSESQQPRYPIKNQIDLDLANGEKVSITFPDAWKAGFSLDGKITLTDECELTWKDKLVYTEEKPDNLYCKWWWSCHWQKGK